MRVLHIIDNLAIGGTQNLALRVMCETMQSGVDVSCCVLGHRDRTHNWDWLPEDVTYFDHTTDYRRPDHVRELRNRVLEVIQRTQPDVLHSWLWTSDFVTAWANGKSDRPHLSHVVDRRTWQESSNWKHRIRRWLTRCALRRSDTRFLAVSAAARDFAIETLQIPPANIAVALNSIEPQDFEDVAPSSHFAHGNSRLVLGMASRLQPEKGHPFMLDALHDLRSRGHDIHLKMTGRGGYQTELEDQARELGLEDCTEFVGFVDSVRQFLEEIDVFMVPSVDSEGLPTTILEAMAAGRPVIATDIGGASEAIDDGVHGRIIPARDPKAIADAVEGLMADVPHTNDMITAARDRIQREFSMSTMTLVVMNTYKDMVAE